MFIGITAPLPLELATFILLDGALITIGADCVCCVCTEPFATAPVLNEKP